LPSVFLLPRRVAFGKRLVSPDVSVEFISLFGLDTRFYHCVYLRTNLLNEIRDSPTWSSQRNITRRHMPKHPTSATAEDKYIDGTTSSACTKSGMTALGISVILLCLIPYWQHRPTEKALSTYLTSRVLLNMDFDQLEQNPAWEYYKESDPKAELTPLGKLPQAYPYPPPQWKPQPDAAPPSTSDGDPAHAEGRKSTWALKVALVAPKLPFARRIALQLPPSSSPNAPASPSGLTVTTLVPLSELNALIDLTRQLNDSQQLDIASNYSNYYVIAIGLWIQKKRMLAWRDELDHRCPMRSIDLTPTKGSFPEPHPDVLFNCLTLRDWRQLAAYEMPSTGSAEQNQIGSRIGTPVDLAIGALPHRGDLASFVAGASLVIVLLYFGAYLREATHSKRFPAPATLFAAFSRTPFANLAFLLALVFPLMSCIALAVIACNWLLYIEGTLILLATCWILLGFQQRSYFSVAFSVFQPKLKE
jgi:hypothetical protein